MTSHDITLCGTVCPQSTTCRRSPLVTKPGFGDFWREWQPKGGKCEGYLEREESE